MALMSGLYPGQGLMNCVFYSHGCYWRMLHFSILFVLELPVFVAVDFPAIYSLCLDNALQHQKDIQKAPPFCEENTVDLTCRLSRKCQTLLSITAGLCTLATIV